MTETPEPKISRICLVWAAIRLTYHLLIALFRHFFLVVCCWIAGTSLKEVRRQIRLRELTGKTTERP
jgi:hypothetical protein